MKMKRFNFLMILAAGFLLTNCQEISPIPALEYVPIESMTMTTESATLSPQQKLALELDVLPENYSDSIRWSSSSLCVTVDAYGMVTAEYSGTATITAIAGDFSVKTTCEITVNEDYVDEYGINHGPGIEIYGTVWAPVNCGFHKDDFKYGKLYQWGRVDGQGYGDSDVTYGYEDAEIPFIESEALPFGEIPEPEVFYMPDPSIHPTETFWYQWISPREDDTPGLDGITDWNELRNTDAFRHNPGMGSPCPKGWKVPTLSEFMTLSPNHSDDLHNNSTVVDALGGDTPMKLNGRWFGPNHATATAENPNGCIFLPIPGERTPNGGKCSSRNSYASYWTSTPFYDEETAEGGAHMIYFWGTQVVTTWRFARGYGYPVRCVKIK